MAEAEKGVASARELYDRDPTFRAGITAWVEERRCDLRIVDLLLEYGLIAQAEGARWAATEPNRHFNADRSGGIVCGPFPCWFEGDYYWYDCGEGRDPVDAHDVPGRHFGRQVNYQTNKFKSVADAILFLLDNWQLEQSGRPEGMVKRRRRRK